MTGRPLEIVDLLANKDARLGTRTTTMSPSSPPIAKTTTAESLSTLPSQPVLTQLRGTSSPKSYNNDIYHSHTNPVAIMDYTPDGNFSSSLVMATLCVAWIFIAGLVLVLLYWLCRRVKRRRALDSAANVRLFLKRYNEDDVRLLNSSLGGWHVVFGRRLVDRVRYYWTKELPGADEASTILFDDDQTILSHHTTFSKSSGHEGGCDTSSCGSLASDDERVLPKDTTDPLSGRRGQILSFQAISYHEAQDSANPGWQRRSNALLTTASTRRLDQHHIQSFLHDQFPSDNMLLSESLPAGGFSVVYCSRLDADKKDVYTSDRIDFYPSDQTDIDRIHACSQPLFQDDDDLESTLT